MLGRSGITTDAGAGQLAVRSDVLCRPRLFVMLIWPFVRCGEEVDYVPAVHEVLREYPGWSKEDMGKAFLRLVAIAIHGNGRIG